MGSRTSSGELYYTLWTCESPSDIDVLRSVCPERTTGLDLYRLVWNRVQRFVPQAQPPRPWDPRDFSSGGDDDHKLVARHIDDVFTVAASPRLASQQTHASCGFLLRRVENKALTDARAAWLTRSFGHTIPCTLDPLDVMEEETIAIDWDLGVFQDRDNLDKLKFVASHASVERNDAIDKGPVPLRHCLDAFTSEEKISEGYCSSCCAHREMTKKLEIWRLPPVMVVHLKRFQFTQTYRRKLVSLVEFPIQGLNLGPCVAPHVECPAPYPMKKTQAPPPQEDQEEQDEEEEDEEVQKKHGKNQ